TTPGTTAIIDTNSSSSMKLSERLTQRLSTSLSSISRRIFVSHISHNFRRGHAKCLTHRN
ncbi:hypothetical protein L9F63_018337, partial [Diploptera punctata]